MSQRLAVQVPLSNDLMVPLNPTGGFTCIVSQDASWRGMVMGRYANLSSCLRRSVVALGRCELPPKFISLRVADSGINPVPQSRDLLDGMLRGLAVDPASNLLARASGRIAVHMARSDKKALDIQMIREALSADTLLRLVADENADAGLRRAIETYIEALTGSDSKALSRNDPMARDLRRSHAAVVATLQNGLSSLEDVCGGLGQNRLSEFIRQRAAGAATTEHPKILLQASFSGPTGLASFWHGIAGAMVSAAALHSDESQGDERPDRANLPRAVLLADDSFGLPPKEILAHLIDRMVTARVAVVIGSASEIGDPKVVVTPSGVAVRSGLVWTSESEPDDQAGGKRSMKMKP